jgi:AAA+ ATPase superfamily predicted ATPase
MTPEHSILEQFRTFYTRNHPEDLEQALEYFSVFGGIDEPVAMELPLDEAIEEEILDNYAELHRKVTALTGGDSTAHALLSGIALGDSRAYSAFKRARLSREAGNEAAQAMCEAGIITREKARPNSSSWMDDDAVSDRLHFTTPFLRFWFAFVSPIFKGIREGDYKEFKERYANRSAEFSDRVFEALAAELLKKTFADDPLAEIGGYWDKATEINIIAKSSSGKCIAASCRNVNTKLKKSELTKLKAKCETAGFTPDIYVLVAKNGFSGELKSLKGETLRLFTLKHFKKLLEA